MVSDRLKRQVDRLLDEAEQAVDKEDWETVQSCTRRVLALDPENTDALAYLAAAERASSDVGRAPSPAPAVSFANGRYQVKRFLGEGGKKKVYLAHDTRLDRDVAFALIKTDGLDAEGRERIEREAQAMGKLGTHPHIVSVFDMGEEDGQPYLVTELMAGGDIEGLLERSPDHRLPIDRAVELAQQVSRGLEFAHEHGLVHRDLKPGNVWLTGDPHPNPVPGGEGIGTAKIGDFGLAVALDRSRLTQAGMMVGTVAYMPPEQALGGEVTPRSDLYSLGAMLYEMVCGRPPFVGDESVAIVTQHLNTPPVAPTWHRSDCPPGLEALVLRLLEKDPQKRPASCGEVLQALTLVGAGSPGLTTTGRPSRASANGDLAPTAAVGASDSPLYRRTFVGREAELRRLEGAFDAAVSGQGGLVMVVGEPGIGKTALCEQLATYAAIRGGRALVGHSYEEGSLTLPYLPFVEALRSYVLASDAEQLRQQLGTGASEVARIVTEVRDRVAVEPRAPGDAEDDRWRLYQAVTGFLHNASLVQPLVLVLEDLHWADQGTLDYLVHLSRNLAGARLLLIGTYRDIEVDRSHPLSGALGELRRITEMPRVALRGLTPDEVQRMLTSLAGEDVPWSLAEAVHRQTEGNPLFVQEVVRYLLEEGLLKRGAVASTTLVTGIPEGLRDVIGKRLSRLGPDTDRILAVAAVIGRDFDLDTLRLVGDLPEEALERALEEATRASILEEQTVRGAVHYRFTHAFFRQTLYEELSAPRRIRLHQRVGAALEAQHAGRPEDNAAALAEHFSHSSDKEDLAKAVRYGEMAARRASAVYAHKEAVRLFDAALEAQEMLDPDDRARRCDLLLDRGDALMPTGEVLATEQAAEEAFALAEALGDQERSSRACTLALAALERYGGTAMFGTPSWRPWVERAGRCAIPGTSGEVWAEFGAASMLMVERRFPEFSRALWHVLELAESLGDPDTLFLVAQRVLINGVTPASWPRVVELAERLARHSRDGVSARALALVLVRSGGIWLGAGDRERAEAAWAELAPLAARSQDTSVLISNGWPEIVLPTLDGRLEEAMEALDRCVSKGEQLGVAAAGHLHASTAGLYARLYLGRAREAIETANTLTKLTSTSPTAIFTRALAEAYYSLLTTGQARVPSLASAPMDALDEMSLAGNVGNLAAAVLCEDKQACRAFIRPLGGLASVISYPSVTCIARHLGDAHTLLGEPGQARKYYDQALEVCQRVRFRPEIALTRLALAELLFAHYSEEKLAALEHLDFAIAEFREMKMQPSLERALKHKGLLSA